ncbi:uncharacterized protein P174DRAFT_440862, partial [Aspergillus novofumigatus IBT 16806]
MTTSPDVWLVFDATIFALRLCGCVLLHAVTRSPLLMEIIRHKRLGRLRICPVAVAAPTPTRDMMPTMGRTSGN